MFTFPGRCCSSDHIDEETRDLLAVGDRLGELLEDILGMVEEGADVGIVLKARGELEESALSDWRYVRGAWKTSHCPGCSSFRRPATDPAPVDVAAELQECRERLYDLCPLPRPARLDGAPARLTLVPANHHATPILHTPHPRSRCRHALEEVGGFIFHNDRPIPLPSPLRITLEEWEDWDADLI